MKPTLLTPLTLFIGVTIAAYPRFKKYEECVSHCDAEPVCQAAYFDTITGDCQVHECISGQTPPDRFAPYIKTPEEYCPGVSPPVTVTEALTSAVLASTSTGVGTGVGADTEAATSPASTGAGAAAETETDSSPASTETSGAQAGLGMLRMDAGLVAAAGCVLVGFLG